MCADERHRLREVEAPEFAMAEGAEVHGRTASIQAGPAVARQGVATGGGHVWQWQLCYTEGLVIAAGPMSGAGPPGCR